MPPLCLLEPSNGKQDNANFCALIIIYLFIKY